MSTIGYLQFIQFLQTKALKQIAVLVLTTYFLIGFAELFYITYIATKQKDQRNSAKIVYEISRYIPMNEKVAIPFSLYFEMKKKGYDAYSYHYANRGAEKTDLQYVKELIANNFHYFIFPHNEMYQAYRTIKAMGCKFEKIAEVGEDFKVKLLGIHESPLWYDIYIIDCNNSKLFIKRENIDARYDH